MARVGITTDYYSKAPAASGTTDFYGSQAKSRFIPAIYSKKVLRKFLNETIFQDICNRDYEGEVRAYGDTVYIRKTPDVSVRDYKVGGTISYDVPEKDAIQMVIDHAKYTAFRVDDVDRAQADLDLVNLFSKNTKKEVQIVVDKDVLLYMSAQVDPDNTGSGAGAISKDVDLGATAGKVVANGNDALQLILDLNQVLDEAAVDMEGRFCVIPAWLANRFKSGDLKRADVTGDGTGVIRTGLIGEIDGMKIYQSNHLPTATGGVTKIIAGTKEATTFAAQIDKSDQLKIPDSFGEYWRTLFVWGRLVTQPTALAVATIKAA